MSSNSFVKWYGVKTDYSLKEFDNKGEAFLDGCSYAIKESGYIYVYGSWTNHRHYKYDFINKIYPDGYTSLEINGWNGYVKNLDIHSQLIIFRIRDKHMNEREFKTTKFIHGVVEGMSKLKFCSTFQDWNHYDLFKKVEEQEKKIKSLEREIEEFKLTSM